MDREDPYRRRQDWTSRSQFAPYEANHGSALGEDFCERPMFRKSIPTPTPSPITPAFTQPVPPWVSPRVSHPSPKLNWSHFPTYTSGQSRND